MIAPADITRTCHRGQHQLAGGIWAMAIGALLGCSALPLRAEPSTPNSDGEPSAGHSSIQFEPHPLPRDQSLWDNSPFAEESVPVAVVPRGFAADLSLAAVSKLRDKHMVIIVNKKTGKRQTLWSDKESADGLKVIDVQANADPLKVKVKITKAGAEAFLSYDSSLLAQQPTARRPIAANSNDRQNRLAEARMRRQERRERLREQQGRDGMDEEQVRAMEEQRRQLLERLQEQGDFNPPENFLAPPLPPTETPE